jgi:hypothetical protein
VAGPKQERGARTHVPEIGYCEEKQALTDRLLVAIRELTLLHSRQTRAVIDNDQDFPRFDVLLQSAQERKDNAKYAWIEHVESHRCAESGEFELFSVDRTEKSK